MNTDAAAASISKSGWPENTIPVFNDVVVSGAAPGIVGEAVCEEGRFSIHGDYGRVCRRITDTRITTTAEAALVAEHILRTAIEEPHTADESG